MPNLHRTLPRMHYRRRLLPRVPNALGEGARTLGEEPPGMPLTEKRSSPSVKNRTLGEGFPEFRPSTRRRIDAVGAVRFFFLKILFPECNTRGRNLFFFIKKLFPEFNTRGRGFIFLKKSSSPSACPRHSGKNIVCCL
jgi:hypothetical protein